VAREPSGPTDDRPVLSFSDRAGWRAWLTENHAGSTGVWLRLAKKGASQPSMSYGEGVEVALCFGWIDGQARREDDHYYLQKYTPRGKRSIWSKLNRERALRLIASGEMQPAGLAEVERAQTDGRWDAAYDSPSRMTVPADLKSALDASPAARAFFEALDSQNRYAMLFRLQTAKRPDTRAKRIRDFVNMLAAGEKIYS
jgi:uncharacterized protein YdeI (YjbR/CyaY-like superfamily)